MVELETIEAAVVPSARPENVPIVPRARLGLSHPRYSIRIAEVEQPTCCAVCERSFVAEGPTGHLDDRPLCDLCLLELESQLGMILALIAVVRSYAATADSGMPSPAVNELLGFARLYGRFADRFGAARPFDIWWRDEGRPA